MILILIKFKLLPWDINIENYELAVKLWMKNEVKFYENKGRLDEKLKKTGQFEIVKLRK